MTGLLHQQAEEHRSRELPSQFAWRLFTEYCSSAPMDERRALGQFFTPPEVVCLHG